MGGGMSGVMGGGAGSIPGTAFGGATDPSARQPIDGFRIIPSIAVGQRYDSNVFFVPKTPGISREDFVTTTIPQVRGLYAGDLGTMNATIGAVGEYYAKNSGLNYVGANAALSLDASKLVNRLWDGAQLTVTETYLYTPQPPGFVTGDLSGEGTNPFLRGFMTGRVNVQSNNVAANLAMPITKTVNLTGGYVHGLIRFGTSEVGQPGTLLDNAYQLYTTGLSARLSSQDTATLNFMNSEFDSGVRGEFTTRGGTVGWSHTFTPSLTLTSAGGAQLLTGTFSGRPIASVIAPTGNLLLLWRDGATAMLLAYNLSVTPSFQFESQPLLTHVVAFTITQQTAIPELLAVASMNYGRGDEYGSPPASTVSSSISYLSWGGTAGLTYRLTPKTFLGVTWSYSNYNTTFGSQSVKFDRETVQVSLTQAFY